jgi:hypothetical protein
MKSDYNINAKCYFSGSGFGDDHELGECSLAYHVIPKCKNVLELGGGAGKVSHVINTLLEDRTQHVVVEPGSSGTGNHGDEHLWKNKEKFGDKYTIVKKFSNDLTAQDLGVLKTDVDCLYVDCEGCLLSFLSDTKIGNHILTKVRYVVNEMDGFVQNKTHDNDLVKLLHKKGFRLVLSGYGCDKRCKTNVWAKKDYKMSLVLFLLVCLFLLKYLGK